MTHKFEALICAVLFTFWSVRLYYKLYDKKVRRYIISIGCLIVFWMIVRMTKGVVDSLLLERLCWYLYYIPLIMTPCIFYVCSNSITNAIGKKKKFVIYFISFILIFLVLTNDFHEFVFKFPNGNSFFNDYKHYIGYYIISIWIFYLFGGGMIYFAKDRLKVKKDFRAFLPLIVLVIGVVYTVLYVINIKYIRDINMSVINSILICIGIELILYLGLIPNNSKYIKTFSNSNLDMIIISLDGNIIYTTNRFCKVPSFIINDIKNKCVMNIYKVDNIIYDIKINKDSYVVLRKDMTELHNIKKEIARNKKYLLKQYESIKIEEKTKRELYEISLRKDVITKIEKKLDDKRKEAKDILLKDDIDDNDLEKIRRIIMYSKKKSQMMIAEFNNDIYNDNGIKVILLELINSMYGLNIDGEVVIEDKILINGNTMAILYDIIYELLDNISNTSVMIYIFSEKNTLSVKVLMGISYSIIDRVVFDNDINIKENVYDTDTELVFRIKVGDNR